jgi:hypothetical protein
VKVNVHQPDETALSAARNFKYASQQLAFESPIGLLAGDFLPVLPVHQRLDKP